MISDAIWVAIIMSMGSIIASILALLASRKNMIKIEQVHIATNSMKDALVKAALIEGEQKGIREERARKENEMLKIDEGVQKELNKNKGKS